MFDQFRSDRCAVNERDADLRVSVAADHQHVGEFELVTGFTGKLLNFQDILGGDTVLFAARANDSVHGFLFLNLDAPFGAAPQARALTAIRECKSLGQRICRGNISVPRWPDYRNAPRSLSIMVWSPAHILSVIISRSPPESTNPVAFASLIRHCVALECSSKRRHASWFVKGLHFS
jgi:hypothetical protein